MREKIEEFGGRRFLLSFCCLWVSSSLLMGGFVSDAIYRDIVIATVAVYIAGNTTQKVKGTAGNENNAE